MQSLFLAARQLFSVFFQDLRDQNALIHGIFFPFDLLVIFMAFSGQYNNVSRFSMVDGIGNCLDVYKRQDGGCAESAAHSAACL